MVNKFFDMVYYINLDKDVERNRHIIELFKMQGITRYKRVSGHVVESNFESIPFYVYRNFNKKDEKYVKGAIGCRLSHLSVIQDAKSNGYDKILIFEDDVMCVKEINDLLLGNYNNIKNFDMLYFGGIQEQLFRNQIVTTHCYALSKDIFDDILNMAIPSGMEIDNFYAKILHHMSVNNRQGGQYIIKKIEPFNSVIQNYQLFGSSINEL